MIVCKTMDLSIAEDYQRVLSEFGGEERVKQYGEVWDCLQKIRCSDTLKGIQKYKTILEDASGIANAIYFYEIYYDDAKRELTIGYVLSYTQVPSIQFYKLRVYNANNEIIKEIRFMPPTPKQFTVAEEIIENIDVGNRFKVELTDMSTVGDRPINIVDVQEQIAHSLQNESVFASRARVIAPKKNADSDLQDLTNDSHDIYAYYGRYPQRGESNVDYVYDDAYDPTRQSVQMMLEGSGNIQLSKYIDADRLEKGDDLAIMDFGKGAIRYSSGMAKLAVQDKLFQWVFMPDWGVVLPKELFDAKNIVHLTYKLGFYQRPLTYENILYVSSLLEKDRDASCRKIRRLRIAIGCVKAGTLVTMEDGSSKSIETIMPGEHVAVEPNGKGGVVNSVWKGKDRELYHIQTVDGCILELTGSHYVQTEGGYVRADELNLGSKVLTKNGEYSGIAYLYIVEGDVEVYNLSVRAQNGTGAMICGGICVADNDYCPQVALQSNELPSKDTIIISQLRQLFLACMED